MTLLSLSLFFLPPKASLFPEPPLDHPLCRDSGRLSPYFSPHFVLPFTSSALFDHLSLYLYLHPFFRASPFVPLFFFLRKKKVSPLSAFPFLRLSICSFSAYSVIACFLLLFVSFRTIISSSSHLFANPSLLSLDGYSENRGSFATLRIIRSLFSVISIGSLDTYKLKKKLSRVRMQWRFQMNHVIFILKGRIIYLSSVQRRTCRELEWYARSCDTSIVISLIDIVFTVT